MRTWREYRKSTAKQCIALDFCTNQGIFAREPTRTPFCLYGGAGYGGKSYLLRTAALEICLTLRDLGFPNQWGVLHCQTEDDIRKRHIEELEREFRGIATVQATMKHGWHLKFHGEGLGGVYLRGLGTAGEMASGRRIGRGAARAFALFDELTELTYPQFRNAIYSVRPDDNPLPFSPILAGSNPDGVGHQWVKEVFHPRYRNLNHPFFAPTSATPFDARNVLFIQSLKTDNPGYYLNQEIVDQRMGTIEEPEILAARNDGLWDIYASGRFAVFRDSVSIGGRRVPLHVMDDWADLWDEWDLPPDLSIREFLENCERFGFQINSSLDYATSPDSVSAYLQFLIDPAENALWFYRLSMVGLQLEDQAEMIKQAEYKLPIRHRYGDPKSMLARPSEVSRIVDQRLSRREQFRQQGIRFDLAINDRVNGWSTCASLLHWKWSLDRTFVQKRPRARFLAMQADGVYGVPELIREIPNLPRDPKNPEDVDKRGGIWHWGDSWRYGAHSRFRGIAPAADEPEFGSIGWLVRSAQEDAQKRVMEQLAWN